jgi:peptidyl-lysine (3S)-dioxygenase / protease
MLHASKVAVEELAQDVGMLWCNSLTLSILDESPTALLFLRDYVAMSRPCIMRLPLRRLSMDELFDQLLPDETLTVDVSPDGNADVIRRVHDSSLNADRRMFVQPEERSMSVEEFQKRLRQSGQRKTRYVGNEPLDRVFPLVDTRHTHPDSLTDDCVPANDDPMDNEDATVYYYSRQNDCLRTELSQLWSRGLFPSSFDWAEQAFGTGPPQAVNLWIGNERATSSMHKDHYENLCKSQCAHVPVRDSENELAKWSNDCIATVYVVSGEKIFTLCPPADAPFLYERDHRSGRFSYRGQAWSVVPDAADSDGQPTSVRWIEANVTQKDNPAHLSQFPLLKYTHPIEVVVPAGCMLYIPALWFHRVTQSCETIGINYWYDMKFESPLYSYFHFLQQLDPSEQGHFSEKDGTNLCTEQ